VILNLPDYSKPKAWSAVKSLLLLTALFAATHQGTAQIPNASFENWTDFGAFDSPDGWFTTNLDFQDDQWAEANSESIDGDFGIRLENEENDDDELMRAELISGDKKSPGFPYSLRPDALTGFFQYEPKDGNDSCYIIVRLSRWNSLSDQREIIGEGQLVSNEEIDEYTPFSIAIDYSSPDDPDTAAIFIYAGKYNGAQRGSRMLIDALSFEGTSTGIVIIDGDELTLTVSPNPASSTITISNDVLIAGKTYSVTSIIGKPVVTQQPLTSATIDVTSYSNGEYILAVYNGTGKLIKKGTFIVMH
jgi:hypothetical protein